MFSISHKPEGSCFLKYLQIIRRIINNPIYGLNPKRSINSKRNDYVKDSKEVSEDDQALKALLKGRKGSFISSFENRVKVYLKPVEVEITGQSDLSLSEPKNKKIYLDKTVSAELVIEDQKNNIEVHSEDAYIKNEENDSKEKARHVQGHSLEEDPLHFNKRNIERNEENNKKTQLGEANQEYCNTNEGKKKKTINKKKETKKGISNMKFLSKKRYKELLRGNHPYIYDFEIANISELSIYPPGELVNVYFQDLKELGIGILNRKSNISVKMIHGNVNATIDDTFFIKRIYESISRRFFYLHHISLYEYMSSLKMKQNILLFSQVIHSIHDQLPGVVVQVLGQSLYIRYDSLSIQKYRDIIENTLDKIFAPKHIFCKRIISQKEKRVQHGKEYILEQIKGTQEEINYIEKQNMWLQNNITNFIYSPFELETKRDRLFLRQCVNTNVLNIHGNVGEYLVRIFSNQIENTKNKDIYNNSNNNNNNYNNCNMDGISILLSDHVRNIEIARTNLEKNECKNVTTLLRENILEELNNMCLSNLKFDSIIFNIKNIITYRRNSYTSELGKRHTVTFKGIHKYLQYLSQLLQKNGLLFIIVELNTYDYHNFLNIVKCAFEKTKTNISIVYENSCSIENCVLCEDQQAWYSRVIGFKIE